VSRRPYKEPFGVERALAIIDEGKGKHFDPDVVGAFYAIKDEILAIRESYGDKARPGADSQRGAPNVR
jgi:putative two-component system response regulator